MPRRRRAGRRKRTTFAQRVKQITLKQSETKRFDALNYSAATIDTTVGNVALHNIPVGDTRDTRDGESIIIRSLSGRFVLGYNSLTTYQAQVVRVVLYHPYQQNDLLTGMNYASYIEPERYKVFFDKLITVSADNPIKVFNTGFKFWSKKRAGLHVRYTGGTGADISRGALYFAIVSDHASNGPILNGRGSVFFKDP